MLVDAEDERRLVHEQRSEGLSTHCVRGQSVPAFPASFVPTSSMPIHSRSRRHHSTV